MAGDIKMVKAFSSVRAYGRWHKNWKEMVKTVSSVRAYGGWHKNWKEINHPESEKLYMNVIYGWQSWSSVFSSHSTHLYQESFFYKEGHNHCHDEDVIISRVYSHSELTPWIYGLLEFIQEICLQKETIHNSCYKLTEQNLFKAEPFK